MMHGGGRRAGSATLSFAPPINSIGLLGVASVAHWSPNIRADVNYAAPMFGQPYMDDAYWSAIEPRSTLCPTGPDPIRLPPAVPIIREAIGTCRRLSDNCRAIIGEMT